MLKLARELDTARKDSTSLLESSEEMAKRIESAPNNASTLERPEITVLLVDDETKVLDIVGTELKQSGCRVIAASSAKQALDQLHNLVDSETAAVLVTDVAMLITESLSSEARACEETRRPQGRFQTRAHEAR